MTNTTSVVATLSSDELVSLIPMTLLAVFYLATDVLSFNRLVVNGRCGFVLTRPQRFVAFVLSPIWMYLAWIENLSTVRGDAVVLTVIGSINTLVGWYGRIVVFNDGYSVTRQQWSSLVTRFVINSLWRWNNYLMYRRDDRE